MSDEKDLAGLEPIDEPPPDAQANEPAPVPQPGDAPDDEVDE